MAHLCTVTLRRVFFITIMRCYFVSIDGQILQSVLIMDGWISAEQYQEETSVLFFMHTTLVKYIQRHASKLKAVIQLVPCGNSLDWIPVWDWGLPSCTIVESSHLASSVQQEPSLGGKARKEQYWIAQPSCRALVLSPDPTLSRGEMVWWTKSNFLS